MKVVFWDNHILVVDKPAGIPTQSEDNKNLHAMAKEWVKKTCKKTGNVFLEPIHRLDKGASGLVLFARTSKALTRLNEQMRQRQIKKIYHAEVEGILPSDEGTLEHYLIHDNYRARVANGPSDPKAKSALLDYQLLYKKPNTSTVEIFLHTGRYHQIRAQMAAIGCPILGDVKYGSSLPYSLQGIALKHKKLEFTHPVTKELLTLHA